MRADTVTDPKVGDTVMLAGRPIKVTEVNGPFVTLGHPVSYNWPNIWPIETLHSLDCQCFAKPA